MCGITGISYSNQKVDSSVLSKACDVLSHRGPNDSGIYISIDQKTGLGHRRLSFIDLSSQGKQPLEEKNTKVIVTFNGEIYNYRELRKDLEQRGYHFNTQTDTEVLLHGFAEWGEQLPNKLDGMFAFCIFNPETNSLFLARDRFGIKPLYYFLDDSRFIFASEIKSILEYDLSLKKVRPQSISLFLANRYIPTPFTIWEGVLKLKPAHSITVDLNSFNLTQKEYWRLSISSNKNAEEETNKRFYQLVLDSVKKHLVSDVTIGSFLSGGYDSSALVYLMQKELFYQTQAFAIGFKEWDQSEDIFAQMVAEATGAELFISKPDKIDLEGVKKLMYHYDDPIADISIIPTYEVSKLAASRVKAVVSGEGADETLGGYWWHKPEKFIFRNKWKKFIGYSNNLAFKDIKYHYIEAMSMGLFNTKELKKALKGDYHDYIPEDPFAHFDQFQISEKSTIKQLQFLDLNTFMTELILAKVDRASMAHSLEVRVPFLQHSYVEYLFSLHPECYMKPSIQKPLLRNLLSGKVPPQILDRPKQGFVGPDKYYMDYDLYSRTLIHGRLVSENVVDQKYIIELTQNKDHWRLWKLFVLENWWGVWL